jgi:hypothetical protein
MMRHDAHELTSCQILATVRFSDDLAGINANALPSQVKYQIASSKLQGQHVVMAYWETGQYAILPCPPGCDMPAPEMVIAAYRISTTLRPFSDLGGAA